MGMLLLLPQSEINLKLPSSSAVAPLFIACSYYPQIIYTATTILLHCHYNPILPLQPY